MRREDLAVHLHHLADAKCVAEALGHDDGTIESSDLGWTVSVVQSSRGLTEVLSALHACLAENEIRFVRVTIDGSTYAMESPPAD